MAPSFDPRGWLWTTETLSDGTITVAGPDGKVSRLPAPQLEGRTIQALAVSRDGARLAVLSRASGVQVLEVMAVVRGDAGEPLALGDSLALGPAVPDSIDLAWLDDVSVAALGSDSGRISVVAVGGWTTNVLAPAAAIAIAARNGVPTLLAVGDGDTLVRTFRERLEGEGLERFGRGLRWLSVVPRLELPCVYPTGKRGWRLPGHRPPIVGQMVEWGRARLGEPIRAVERAARDIARLIVPVACPGCGEHDVRWCDDCAAPWWEAPLRSESLAPRLDIQGRPALPVWAIAELAGASHSMIVAWKDGGRRDLDRFFADAAGRAAACIAPASGRRDPDGAPIAVVPVPARAASTRRRGVDLPLLLASAAARGLCAEGVEATVRNALRIGRGEQRGASARQRWRQSSSLRVARDAGPPATALLVDDVMTTGATLAAAVRSLDVTFLTVGAGLCLAAAPPSGARTLGALS